MRRYIPFLAAAVCAATLSLLSPVEADASPYAAIARAVSASQPQSAALLDVGYYGGGDYYGDDQKQDYSDDRNYGGYGKGGYGSGYGYSHQQEHHEDYTEMRAIIRNVMSIIRIGVATITRIVKSTTPRVATRRSGSAGIRRRTA